jgi:hypothetical protein
MRGFFNVIQFSRVRTIPALAIVVASIVSCSDDRSSHGLYNADSVRHDSILAAQNLQAISNVKEYDLANIIGVDIDGDGDFDYIQFNRAEGKVLIGSGNDSTRQVMSFESEDGTQVDDFRWVNSWGLITDKTIPYSYAVDGELRDSIFTLENPAIKLWQDGGGSGFFTFKGGKWIWVTTGC